jgi:hypothetical protein
LGVCCCMLCPESRNFDAYPCVAASTPSTSCELGSIWLDSTAADRLWPQRARAPTVEDSLSLLCTGQPACLSVPSASRGVPRTYTRVYTYARIVCAAARACGEVLKICSPLARVGIFDRIGIHRGARILQYSTTCTVISNCDLGTDSNKVSGLRIPSSGSASARTTVS